MTCTTICNSKDVRGETSVLCTGCNSNTKVMVLCFEDESDDRNKEVIMIESSPCMCGLYDQHSPLSPFDAGGVPQIPDVTPKPVQKFLFGADIPGKSQGKLQTQH